MWVLAKELNESAGAISRSIWVHFFGNVSHMIAKEPVVISENLRPVLAGNETKEYYESFFKEKLSIINQVFGTKKVNPENVEKIDFYKKELIKILNRS